MHGRAQMRLTPAQLKDMVVTTMQQCYGNSIVDRHHIIDVVEHAIRNNGQWETSDDIPSRSTDPKSKGRANIDYAISALKKEDRLDNPARNQWRVR